MTPLIYLAGHFKADDYRAKAQGYIVEQMNVGVLNPFRLAHDLRGNEAGAFKQIVQWDLEDIVQCTAVLANFTHMSVGTSMECWFAHSIGRPIYAFVEGEDIRVSPWIEYVAEGHTCCTSLDSALHLLHQNVIGFGDWAKKIGEAA